MEGERTEPQRSRSGSALTRLTQMKQKYAANDIVNTMKTKVEAKQGGDDEEGDDYDDDFEGDGAAAGEPVKPAAEAASADAAQPKPSHVDIDDPNAWRGDLNTSSGDLAAEVSQPLEPTGSTLPVEVLFTPPCLPTASFFSLGFFFARSRCRALTSCRSQRPTSTRLACPTCPSWRCRPLARRTSLRLLRRCRKRAKPLWNCLCLSL